MIIRTIRPFALLSAMLFLAGCYETDFAVIEAGKGVEIPGLAGTFTLEDKTGAKVPVTIEDRSDSLGSGGYEYLLHTRNGNEFQLRADRMQDGLWLIQAGRDEDNGAMRYLFLYLAKDGDNFVSKIPNPLDFSEAPGKLAAEYRVEIVSEQVEGSEKTRDKLSGTREDIHTFLRANPDRLELIDVMRLVPQ